MLHHDVLTLYQKQKLRVENILTDNGREFCGTDQHPYELYLELSDIKHRRTRVRHPRIHGFVERFNRPCWPSFSGSRYATTSTIPLSLWQADFDLWFQFYNEKRPHLGYSNQGEKPPKRILVFKKTDKSDA